MIHNGFVKFSGEKMSKSVGNIKLINTLLKNKSGQCIRLALLSSHYRQPLNWTDSVLEQAEKNLERLNRIAKQTENVEITNEEKNILCNDIKNALMDDLNTPNALGMLFKMTKKLSEKKKLDQKKIKSNLIFITNSLGLFLNKKSENNFIIKSKEKKYIEDLIKERNNARIEKDFETADKLRDKLETLGVTINDTRDDTSWKKTK